MCRWRSKGDFARFAVQLFLRAFSESRRYEFCGRAVSGPWLAFGGKLWGDVEHEINRFARVSQQYIIGALDPFWCATLFLRDARIFYGVVFDLISMASRGLPWRFFCDPRDPPSEKTAMGTSGGLRPMAGPTAGGGVQDKES